MPRIFLQYGLHIFLRGAFRPLSDLARWYALGMETVYIDSLFALNFIIDYLLLLISGRICALPLVRRRIALGAALGGLYAVGAAVFPEVFTMISVKAAVGGLMCLAAYGAARRFGRLAVTFFAVSAAFAGAVYALATLRGEGGGVLPFVPVSLPVLLLAFAVCYALLSLVFRRSGLRAGRCILQVQVTLGGRAADFAALSDSGNELIDPLTGRGVLVAELSALAPLLSAPCPAAADPVALFSALSETPELHGRLRLLACSGAAGGTVLPCFTPDNCRVGGEERALCVAVTPRTLCADGEYRAIVN